MTGFEEEFQRFRPVINRLSNIALLGKKVEVKGQDKFIQQGPNIIVGNHVGSFKDIAVLFKVVPRPIFFTANKMIFDVDEFNQLIKKHLRRYLKSFGLFVDLYFRPLKAYFVRYIATNISKVGTIPVDLYQKKRLAIRKCERYLRDGRAIVAFQGRGRIIKKAKNPYIPPFRYGVPVMAYNLYQQNKINVPVTPLAIFGAHVPFGFPGTIKMNVGAPMYITECLREDFSHSIECFRQLLEERVTKLLLDIV
ncbi:MAG: hypothetical protein B5M54_01005 [Candidatus Aminicenantes bacterium 4484_214]|nr:MAG: hypothetical protein B5M54_01005 [Candidatus Aminicenantes bacterium 4484_214]